MSTVKRSPAFREWLAEAIEETGITKRGLARRMAEKHPRGVSLETIDTARRTIHKILAGDLTPTQPTRDAISDALGRSDAPAVESDEDEGRDLASTLQEMVEAQAELTKRLNRVLRQVSAA